MSVGICLLNRRGISFGADSYVRNEVLSIDNYNDNDDKILPLTDRIACLRVSQQTFGKTPAELIFLEFKEFLKTIPPIKNVFTITDIFTKFLKDKTDYFDFPTLFREQRREIIESYAETFRKLTLMVFHKWHEDDDGINNLSEEEIFGLPINDYEAYQSFLNSLSEAYVLDECLNAYDEDEKKKAFELYNKEGLREVFRKIFDKDNQRSDEAIDEYYQKACEVLLSKEIQNNKIEIIFAGYSEDDAYPKAIQYNLLTYLDKLIYEVGSSCDVKEDGCEFICIGNKETINAFVNGVSTTWLENLNSKMGDLVLNDLIGTSLGDDFFDTEDEYNEIKDLFQENVDEVQDTMLNEGYNLITKPFISNLKTLDVDDLIECAKAFIDMAILKSSFSFSDNKKSINGGQADIACLTKIGGFTWCKHKVDYK